MEEENKDNIISHITDFNTEKDIFGGKSLKIESSYPDLLSNYDQDDLLSSDENFPKYDLNNRELELSGNINDFISKKFDLKRKSEDKFKLTGDEQEKVDEIIQYFTDASLNYKSLYELFEDWQTPKTRAIKKFLITIITILSFGFVSGVDLRQISLLGVPTQEVSIFHFLIAITLILIISYAYYILQNLIDKNVAEARIKTVKNELKVCSKFVAKLEEIVKSYEVDSVEEIIKSNTPRKTLLSDNSPLNVFESIVHYKSELEAPNISNKFLNLIEKWGITFMFSISLIYVYKTVLLIHLETVSWYIIWFLILTYTFLLFPYKKENK